MKIKKPIIGLLGAVMLFTGCGGGTPSAGITEFSSAEKAQYTFAETSISDSDTLINSFAVISDDATAALICKNSDYFFTVYKNGKPITETEISGFYQGICYNPAEECFYSYDAQTKQLHIMDKDFTLKETLADVPEAFEISAMNIIDNALYFVMRQKNPFVAENILPDEETGYINYGECAFSVDLSTKELKQLNIPNVICQSYSDDTLYYYRCQNGHYSLDLYDRDKGVLKTIMNMDDIGYVNSFAIIGSEMLYITGERSTMFKRDLNTGADAAEPGVVYIIRNSDFEVYKNSLIYLNRDNWSIQRCGGNPASPSGSNRASQFEGENLVISGWYAYNFLFNTRGIYSQTGISTTISEDILTDTEMKLKLLAGDSDVDIYIFSSYYRIGRDIRNMGCYVPLTDEAIVAERDQYFDFLADFTVNDNGDIWCVPITADAEATFYIPENLEALNISTEDLKTFDGYFSALEKVKAQDKYEYYISGGAINFGEYIENEYKVNYGFQKFDDPVFRNRFERIYSGWVIWENPEINGEHPLFKNPYATFGGTTKSMDTETVAFKCSSMSYFNSDGNDISLWRAMPLPTVSAPDEKVPMAVVYATVNPFSEKKEAAEAYLGFIAENHLKYMNRASFIYKDKSLYEGRFDTTTPCFDDLYDIYSNGKVYEELLTIDFDYKDKTIAYQRGEMTLDEYIADLERTVEMTLNE